MLADCNALTILKDELPITKDERCCGLAEVQHLSSNFQMPHYVLYHFAIVPNSTSYERDHISTITCDRQVNRADVNARAVTSPAIPGRGHKKTRELV